MSQMRGSRRDLHPLLAGICSSTFMLSQVSYFQLMRAINAALPLLIAERSSPSDSAATAVSALTLTG